MDKIVITGGCGFIGSHLTDFLFKKFRKSQFIIIDKLTYAANKKYLKKINNDKRVKIVVGDINNSNLLLKLTFKTDLLIHLAAESHVDRSFSSVKKFIRTNVQGTRNVLDACRINKVKRIIHVSTDEVYGEIYKGSFEENSSLNPTNPYASTKAAAEMIVSGYKKSFNMDINIVRSNNIFGTRQYPEKIIPSCCYNILNNKKILIHGSGNQRRTFLYVDDFSKAIFSIINNWKSNEIYNIGSSFEYKIIDIVDLVLKKFNKNFDQSTKFVKDRLFNDFRYSVNIKKIKRLKWKPEVRVEDKIDDIINWYKNNIKLFQKINKN
jgi:nucleoside-diphosphate-sugar epimerase